MCALRTRSPRATETAARRSRARAGACCAPTTSCTTMSRACGARREAPGASWRQRSARTGGGHRLLALVVRKHRTPVTHHLRPMGRSYARKEATTERTAKWVTHFVLLSSQILLISPRLHARLAPASTGDSRFLTGICPIFSGFLLGPSNRYFLVPGI